MSEIVFSDVLTALNNPMDERREAYESHLEHTAHNSFDSNIEACVGELLTSYFQHALLQNELLQQRVL